MGERRLTVVSVAYPFATVSADPVGGAEQVLAHCDRALVAAGHRSIVIAPAGSEIAGELRPIPSVAGSIDDERRGAIGAELDAALTEVIDRERPDVIHFHGLEFHEHLPPPGPAVIATLHLPLDWYPARALCPERPRTWLHPVSANQAKHAPPDARLAPPIENGVPIPPATARKGRFAVAMGRVCPEKGFDDAIDAAREAAMPLLLAGAVFPYPEHRRFFDERIGPRLDGLRRWIGAVAGARKQRLLARARCLLVPSKVPETSSLVAMEALAAGTPVIAYRHGALPDVVEHGETGFLVDDVGEMAAAMRRIDAIDPERCRMRARERFPVERMTGAYLARYAEVARC
ncbi:MAG TPA: glycosyltransferase [Sphingomonas sp.]|nr:glycosyltransferase [Sphingomonas sp.]